MSNATATKPQPGNTTVTALKLNATERKAAIGRVQKYAEISRQANALEATRKAIKPNVEETLKREGGAVVVTIFKGTDDEKLVTVQFETSNNPRCGQGLAEARKTDVAKNLVEQVMVADPKKVEGLRKAGLITDAQAEALLLPCETTEKVMVRDVKKG